MFERQQLEAAAASTPVRVGADLRFVTDAVARLRMGERLYGDRWARTPFQQLLGELLEEAADLGAWGVLAMQSLDDLGDDARELVLVALDEAVRAGARAHSAVLWALQDVGSVPPAGREAAR